MAWDDPEAIPFVPPEGVVEATDGTLRAGLGGGIQPLVPYLVTHLVFPTVIPVAGPLEPHVDYSITLEVSGYEGWRPDRSSPAHPWAGATHVVTLSRGAAGWGLTMSSLFEGSEQPLDTSGFAIITSNTLIIGIDMATITGLGPDQEFGYGYAGHLHDGRHGSCADCPSRISTLPGFPRPDFPRYGGGPLVKPGFDPHFEVSEIRAIGAPDGFIWLSFTPVAPWGPGGMPTRYFSQHFQFGVAVPDDQAGAFFGIQEHDGDLTSFGSGPDGDLPAQFFSMSDGSVVARTDFTIEESLDGIDVTFEGGYLPTREGVFTSISRRFNIPGAEVVEADPLAFAGATPLFDFTTFQDLRPPPTLAPTTATPSTGVPTTAAPTSGPPNPTTTAVSPTTAPAAADRGDTCWLCWLAGGAVVGAPVGVWLLRRRDGGGPITDI